MNEIPSFAAKWAQQEDAILSEISQIQTEKEERKQISLCSYNCIYNGITLNLLLKN